MGDKMKNLIFLQRMLLSSLIQITLESEKPFEMDEEYFDMPLHKSIVRKLNKTIQEGKDLFITGLAIEEWIGNQKNESYKDEWIEIISTMPITLSVAKKYYADLVNLKMGALV